MPIDDQQRTPGRSPEPATRCTTGTDIPCHARNDLRSKHIRRPTGLWHEVGKEERNDFKATHNALDSCSIHVLSTVSVSGPKQH